MERSCSAPALTCDDCSLLARPQPLSVHRPDAPALKNSASTTSENFNKPSVEVLTRRVLSQRLRRPSPETSLRPPLQCLQEVRTGVHRERRRKLQSSRLELTWTSSRT